MHTNRLALSVLAALLLLSACGRSTTHESADPSLAPGLPAGWERELPEVTGATLPASPAHLSALAAGCPTKLAAPYDANVLDTGLYWYSASEAGVPGGVGCKARADGAAISGYYDPNKPTIIYVHGWQNGSVTSGLIGGTTQSNGRENLYFKDGGLNPADHWIQRGWNVGIFHWTQLADDEGTGGAPYHAQAKVWTPSYQYNDVYGRLQDIRMRYRNAAGGYTYAGMPSVSAGQLFYNAYKSALSQYAYAGGEGIRVVGHSLGSQMALALAWQAYSDGGLPTSKKPKRVVLADPYWTPYNAQYGHSYGYLSPDASPAARARRYVPRLKELGAVVEWIKSSRLNDLGGDNNEPLIASASRTEVFPEYITDWNAASGLARKHAVAPRWYFWSKQFAPGTATAASAANTLSRAADVMNASSKYDQQAGRGTATPGDDTFSRASYP